ncbi:MULTISPECIES: alanine/glycine:cation symporter family protein [unclassified Halobacteriovorax]|uniref:alanine/glycine:cation symporter family protein n=1 Tax=unclassified Halobacteriovorax TaxID=2639665 RepID=UPI003999708A
MIKIAMSRTLMGIIFSIITLSTYAQDYAQSELDLQDKVNNIFGVINGKYYPFLFWNIPIIDMPLILFVMVFGGVFFTLRLGFINIRLFKHAIDVIRGKYDNPEDEGDITHFQALTSALSATVGLGNIAGVALAIGKGGPGVVLWLWIIAFFGMSMKFASSTFGQMFKHKTSNGDMLGGPMVYLTEMFKKTKLIWVGKFLGIFYAIMTIGASFGGGNLFQANQTFKIIADQHPGTSPWIVGIILAFLAGVVLIGGIKKIGTVTSKLVPIMCAFYVFTCLAIILSNYSNIPHMFSMIFREAMTPDAVFGGAFAVMLVGIQRASFSNEAGLGSAAIAHSAAKTSEPVREGVVAMIGPVIDTHIVCTITALTLLVTNAHIEPSVAGKGVEMTAYAFATLGDWAPYCLLMAICVFAYSTVISWSYYGERATLFLFEKWIGFKSVKFYRLCYVFIIILGPVLEIGHVLDFADLMLLSIAFPNIIGMVCFSNLLKAKADDYITRFKSGQMKTYN